MFYVMVEIANYRQISRLSSSTVEEIHELLKHFGQNRGAKLVKDQNGYFLFSFHPQREKILHLISDFLFLTMESLKKKVESLFGFNLILEESEDTEELLVFNRLKSLLFQTTDVNTVWAGPLIQNRLNGLFPLQGTGELKEISGPVHKPGFLPLGYHELLEVSGWIDQLRLVMAGLHLINGVEGHVLRLRSDASVEKLAILKTVLRSLFATEEDFPLVFPLSGSIDFLSQLLGQVNSDFVSEIPLYLTPEEIRAWQAQPHLPYLLGCLGGSAYPGDHCGTDAAAALSYYYLGQIRRLKRINLPPVFLFLTPETFEGSALKILDQILVPLVNQEGLHVLIMESEVNPSAFLADLKSSPWSFPGFAFSAVVEKLGQLGWSDRFPSLTSEAVDACRGSAAALAHLLWGIQEERLTLPLPPNADVSWSLLLTLDGSHHKVYYVFLLGKSLLKENDLVDFFHYLGEDQAVILDKVQNLKSLGYMIFAGRNLSLDETHQSQLAQLLQQEGEELRSRLADFLFTRWTADRTFSEILFPLLLDSGKFSLSLKVLNHYVSHKINRRQGDWMALVRPSFTSRFPLDMQDSVVQLTAAFKLRYALNLKNRIWQSGDLTRLKKYFTGKTELTAQGEWLLQLGRFHLYHGDGSVGFQLLKKALMAAQENEDRLLEIRANTEIGQTLIMKHRLEEGQEYFEMAGKHAEKLGAHYNWVVAGGLDAVCRFLYGSLHETRKLIDTILPVAVRAGMGQWVQFFYFLQARIDMDCGLYDAALSNLLLAISMEKGEASSHHVLRHWHGRCLHFLGERSEARSLLESCPESMERNFFLAEIEAGEKKWASAAQLLGRARELEEPILPFTGETLVWSSGFSNMEDKVLEKNSPRGVLRQQVEAYSLFVQSMVDPAEQIQEGFQGLLTEKHLLEVNPFSHQVYFWYFLALPAQESTVEALRLTLLGRALKDLQVRGSRIEEPQLRHNYLHRVPWNAQMMGEAKRYKLI